MRAIRNAAKAPIIQDTHLLTLELRDEEGTFFILPGGGQGPGETLAETVRRECLEELGAAIVVRELRYVREFVQEAPQRVEFIFRCTLAPGARLGEGLNPDAGQIGPLWLPLRELTARRFYPLGPRPLLADAPPGSGPVYLGNLR